MYSGEQERNVLLIGKVRSGKSTIADRITRKLSTDGNDYTELKVSMIDTAGFDEMKMSFSELKKINQDISCKASSGINLIIFTTDGGRIPRSEINIMQFYIEHLPTHASAISALVLTKLDGKSDKERGDYINDLKGDATYRSIVSFMLKGIYAVGFPNLMNTNDELAKELGVAVNKDIATLHDLILKATAKEKIEFTQQTDHTTIKLHDTPNQPRGRRECCLVQ